MRTTTAAAGSDAPIPANPDAGAHAAGPAPVASAVAWDRRGAPMAAVDSTRKQAKGTVYQRVNPPRRLPPSATASATGTTNETLVPGRSRFIHGTTARSTSAA